MSIKVVDFFEFPIKYTWTMRAIGSYLHTECIIVWDIIWTSCHFASEFKYLLESEMRIACSKCYSKKMKKRKKNREKELCKLNVMLVWIGSRIRMPGHHHRYNTSQFILIEMANWLTKYLWFTNDCEICLQ